MNQWAYSIKELDNVCICAVPNNTYGTRDNLVCVRQSDGAAFLVDENEAYLLSRMSTAKTASEWLDTLCRDAVQGRMRPGRYPSLGQLFKRATSFKKDGIDRRDRTQYRHLPLYKKLSIEMASLLDRELLVPAEHAQQSIVKVSNTSIEKCRITTLCIPTCGRSESLLRCVRSFHQNLHHHEREDATILVVDDSVDRVAEGRNREALSALCGSGSPSIQFVGFKERQSFIDALLRKDAAPPEVLKFALDAEKLITTVGAVRNTMMLLTAGQHILQTDDDTFCSYVSDNAGEGCVTISSCQEPYQTHFFPDRKSNLKKFPTTADIDPFAIHESVLGKPLSNILGSARRISWIDANPHEFVGPRVGDIRVDITTTGASGDPGMGSCVGLLTVSPEATLERVYSGRESYQSIAMSREVVRMVEELTLSQRPALMTMSVGINNTRLQPPFFPLGRNEDEAFARLYRLADSRSLIGHLPFAISHLPESKRGTSHSADQAYRLQLTDIVQMCLAWVAKSKEASLSRNLRSIGEQLRGLGSMPHKTFRAFLRDRFVHTQANRLIELQGIVNDSSFRNKEWMGEMNSLSSSIRRAIRDDDAICPADLVHIGSHEESLLKAQSYIAMYGTLMLYWENISDASRDLMKLRREWDRQ